MPGLIAAVLLGLPLLLVVYSYLGYPAILWLLARRRAAGSNASVPADWPTISITLPAYNEQSQIRGTIESLLGLDYPPDRRQILVVSDASTDGTDDIVSEYADRGIELLRMPVRGGKGAAERAAAPHLRGEIVVNTDATIRIEPAALKRLMACFSDPEVGLASGRDISVSRLDQDVNVGESGYVGYEMWVRRLESRVSGIVGASGCFYAIRSELHRMPLPPALSRDFASAMIARENGYRAISVDEARCLVPRTASLHREYRRKVRTMTRGMRTLAHKRHLLNPVKYGGFAWMLFSHKVCRWLVPWSMIPAAFGLVVASTVTPVAAALLVVSVLCAAAAMVGWHLSEKRHLPRLLSIPAFLAAGNVAAIQATIRAARMVEDAVWEPTRRDAAPAASPQ